MESSAINKSLFVLAQCVEAISKKQSRIPYRESKMTRILSLGQNNGLTLMILNLAPVRSYHLDTLSSLNFANRTKKIEVAEVENEPMYRTVVKPLAATASIGGATMARQPLRPLHAAGNANLAQEKGAEKKKAAEKPIKAFSVYSDRKAAPRTSNLPSQNQGVRRAEPSLKRSAEATGFGTRPTKRLEAGLSKESIEAMVAKMVDEKLAEKALQDASGRPPPALSADLQKRLDELEHRIEMTEEDGKKPGLDFILMGKQHQVRGEDTSALRMYQMALPYFPDNERLRAKMRTLEERIRKKREAEMHRHSAPVEVPAPIVPPRAQPSKMMAPLKAVKKQPEPTMTETIEPPPAPADDDDFVPAAESDEDDAYASDASFQYKTKTSRNRKPKKTTTTKKLPIFRDVDDSTAAAAPAAPIRGDQTPRTAHLLRIINSRDVAQIKALKGVGTKRADAIVNCLVEMEEDEIRDLESLAMLKGVGGRTVTNMRMGISVDVGGF